MPSGFYLCTHLPTSEGETAGLAKQLVEEGSTVVPTDRLGSKVRRPPP